MPTDCYWRGDAVATQEVKTFTVGGVYADGQVYTITINTKPIRYTSVLGDTNTTVAAALYALLIATDTTPAEFDEVGWSLNGLIITGTFLTPGVPWTATTSATGTGTFVTATTTTATGPNYWNNALNWSSGTVPVSGDSVYIRQSNIDILYGTDQNAVTLLLWDVDSTFTGKIGLNDWNTNGYVEYRNTFLKISATTAFIGRGAGTGSGRIRWNAGTVQTTLSVYGTGTPDDGVVAVVDFIGTHASNVVSVQRGTLAAGRKPTDAATILTLNMGSKDNQQSDAVVYSGYNVTLGTVNMNGGTLDVWNGATTCNVTQGTLNCNKGAFTTINNASGTVNYDTAGTCGTYVGGTNSLLDCSRTVAARTITAATFDANSSFRDPAKTVTFGGSGAFIRCKVSELREFDAGELFYFQRS